MTHYICRDLIPLIVTFAERSELIWLSRISPIFAKAIYEQGLRAYIGRYMETTWLFPTDHVILLKNDDEAIIVRGDNYWHSSDTRREQYNKASIEKTDVIYKNIVNCNVDISRMSIVCEYRDNKYGVIKTKKFTAAKNAGMVVSTDSGEYTVPDSTIWSTKIRKDLVHSIQCIDLSNKYALKDGKHSLKYSKFRVLYSDGEWK